MFLDNTKSIHYHELLDTKHFETFLHDALGINVVETHLKRFQSKRVNNASSQSGSSDEKEYDSYVQCIKMLLEI